MTRVATIPLQRTLASSMARTQSNLAESQVQLSTGKKADDYAGLGLNATRALSARSMLAQQSSYKAAATYLSTTLSIYDASLTQIDNTVTDLRTRLLTALGTDDSSGLQNTLEAAFADMRSNLNAASGGVSLFAGSQSKTKPFIPTDLSELATLDPADAFANDTVRQSSRVGDGVDLQYGILASDVATDLVAAFGTLAAAGPFGDTLTDAQMDAIRTALDQFDTGLGDVRAANAVNGRNQNRAEMMAERADERSDLLTDVIGSIEDADMAEVAMQISQRQTVLEASYSVFARLSSLSLTNYI